MDSLGNVWKHIYLGPRNRSTLSLLIIVSPDVPAGTGGTKV